MKKNILPIVFSCTIFYTLLLVSCSKSKDSVATSSRGGYMKMKLDGVLKEYDTCYGGGFSQAATPGQTYYQVNFHGGRPGDYCGIYANDLTPMKKGTYTSVKNPVTNLPMAGLGAYRAPGSTDIYISYQAGWPLYDITITLLEITTDHIKGTFQGKLRLIGGTKVIDVTEGEFEYYNN